MLGLLWGAYTGDYRTSLAIAVFFELFWLDLIPVGTFIPPHLTGATFCALAMSKYFGFTSAPRIMILLFAAMPMAWLGARLDGYLREGNRKGYNDLLIWARRGDMSRRPSRLIARSVATAFVAHWVMSFVALVLMSWVLELLYRMTPGVFALRVTWWHLWFAATLGGVMSLRVRRAYLFLGAGIAFLLLFTIISSI